MSKDKGLNEGEFCEEVTAMAAAMSRHPLFDMSNQPKIELDRERLNRRTDMELLYKSPTVAPTTIVETKRFKEIKRAIIKTRKKGAFYVERELRRRRRRRLVGYCKRKWYYVWVNGVRMRYDCEWRLASDIAMAKAMKEITNWL